MASGEPGIVYKASKRAFVGNYALAAAVVFLAFLLIRTFGLEFSLSPSGFLGFAGTASYFLFAVVAGYLVLEPAIDGVLRRYAITNEEVVRIEGIFRKKRTVIPYQSVSEVKVTKGFLGRILNYGTVEVAGMKEGSLMMRHMTDPEQIQRLLQNKISQKRRKVSGRETDSVGGLEEEDGA